MTANTQLANKPENIKQMPNHFEIQIGKPIKQLQSEQKI